MFQRILSLITIVALLAPTRLVPAATPRPIESGLDHPSDMKEAPKAFCDTVAEIPLVECEALVALYDSTNGANWTNHTSWMETSTPCSWYGTECYEGHVTRLMLSNNQLSGTIPPELGDLANLQLLYLFWNQLSGTIPPELSNLTNLQELHLNSNLLSGTIPSELGNLTNLQVLSLGWNQLNGAIPPELGSLTNLMGLGLPYNQLSGTIPPELGNLTNLLTLHLYGNQLTGVIPPELGNLAKLQLLNLDENLLNGTIPPELGNLTNLQEISLSYNHLTGTIPAELGNLSHLQVLGLSKNQLSGTIPPELGDLPNLQYLVLNENLLSSSIPAKLGNLTNLQELVLDSNQLSGTIPLELGNLKNLQVLGLSRNQLNGTIPPELGNLTNLRILTLYINKLSGSLPHELGNLINLEGLSLYNNQLGGEIPPAITNLVNLGINPWLTVNFGGNMLKSSNPAVIAFLNVKDPDWASTQTVPPTGLHISSIDSESVRLAWTPILYTSNGGYYEISYATALTSTYTVYGVTDDKAQSSYNIDGLPAGITHYFRLRTYTPAYSDQQNDLWSEYTSVIPGSTAYAPPQADFSATPTSGIVPLEVSFANLSSGVYDACTWAFGDSATSTTCNPVYTYTTTGVYSVTLTVSGPGGSSQRSRSDLIAVGAQTTVDPGNGGTLVYTSTVGNTTEVQVPTGAVTDTITLSYTPVPTATEPAGFAFAGNAFDLEASQNGVPQPTFTFQQPVTITIHYTDSDVANLQEDGLTLKYWDEATIQWVDAATTCAPPSTYDRHPDENWLSVPICHLSQYALMAPEQHRVYLPLAVYSNNTTLRNLLAHPIRKGR